MKIIDLHQIPLDTFVRKTIHVPIEKTGTIQKFSGKDELSNYTVVGIKTRRTKNNARALENASIINDVFDSAFLTIMNGAMTVGSLIPLPEVEDASRENPQFGLILAISDFRIETSGVTVSNKDAIVSGEYLELTFILIPKQ